MARRVRRLALARADDCGRGSLVRPTPCGGISSSRCRALDQRRRRRSSTTLAATSRCSTDVHPGYTSAQRVRSGANTARQRLWPSTGSTRVPHVVRAPSTRRDPHRRPSSSSRLDLRLGRLAAAHSTARRRPPQVDVTARAPAAHGPSSISPCAQGTCRLPRRTPWSAELRRRTSKSIEDDFLPSTRSTAPTDGRRRPEPYGARERRHRLGGPRRDFGARPEASSAALRRPLHPGSDVPWADGRARTRTRSSSSTSSRSPTAATASRA